jgi:hypothetical protein
MTNGQTDFSEIAKMAAARAHEDNFESRRGVHLMPEINALCIYNNNPYTHAPQRRDEETAELREWLRQNGYVERAFASYPEDGYSTALIVDVKTSPHQDAWYIAQAYEAIVGDRLGIEPVHVIDNGAGPNAN